MNKYQTMLVDSILRNDIDGDDAKKALSNGASFDEVKKETYQKWLTTLVINGMHNKNVDLALEKGATFDEIDSKIWQLSLNQSISMGYAHTEFVELALKYGAEFKNVPKKCWGNFIRVHKDQGNLDTAVKKLKTTYKDKVYI